MAGVKTAMWAQGAISGCGAAGSDSKNMARRRQFKTTWFQPGFHTVLGNLQLMASRSLSVNLFVFNKKDNSELKMCNCGLMRSKGGYCILGVNGLMESI